MQNENAKPGSATTEKPAYFPVWNHLNQEMELPKEGNTLSFSASTSSSVESKFQWLGANKILHKIISIKDIVKQIFWSHLSN